MRNPVDRWTTWRIATEKRLVTEGAEAAHRLWLMSMGRFALGLGSLLGAQLLPGAWATLAWAVVGGLVAGGALAAMRAPSAYKSGWLDGRTDMVGTVRETGSFVHAFEYDAVHVMGLAHPIIPDSPEGLE